MQYFGNLIPLNPYFQAIYSSQLYGTFFSVYVRFTYKDMNSDKYILEKIEFELINYKGSIDIGISNVYGIFDAPDDDNVLQKTICLELQGLRKNEPFTFNCLGAELDRNKLLVLNRTLIPMASNYPNDRAVFDDEFLYREGLPTTGGFYEPRKPTPPTTYNPNEVWKESPGSICPRALNMII